MAAGALERKKQSVPAALPNQASYDRAEMAVAFPQTLRALGRDSFPWSLVVVGAAVVAAWLTWFLAADVAVIEATPVARLEVVDSPRSIESEVTAKVVTTNLTLGRSVTPGEALVELDATSQRLEIAELQARARGIEPQLAALEEELASEERALGSDVGAGRAATDSSKHRLAEAEAALRLARDELLRREQLLAKNAIAGTEVTHARGEVERLEAVVAAARSDAERVRMDSTTNTGDRRARVERLRRERARLAGDLDILRAQIERLQNEIAKRTLRAPVAGKLAAVSPLVVGDIVRDGDTVATVLPSSSLRVIAHFTPSAALGRVRRGQRGWLRLDGFAWTQYGALPCVVEAVAAETQHGKIRVELAVSPDAPSTIPQQHGLPGTLEVNVETVAPVTLVTRAVGRVLATEQADP